jgi:aminoglycoside phosphotransferase (APT) family kinase protein
MAEIDETRYQRIAQHIDPRSKLIRIWALTGGVSAQVTALEVEQPEGIRTKLLVRQHGETDLRHNPHIAADEYKLLRITQGHGLATPRPYVYDESCTILPSPYVVVEFIEGDTEFDPANLSSYLEQAATQLARIHQVSDSPELAFLPKQGRGFGARPERLDLSLNEDRIRDRLESVSTLPHTNALVLLHGDYWPGNLLWRDGRLAAVIDWEDARTGDPLADVGNMRLETLFFFDVDAMDAFTRSYAALTTIDMANLPYWDLCAALRPCSKLSGFGLDEATEQRLRERHRWFVEQAIAALHAP